MKWVPSLSATPAPGRVTRWWQCHPLSQLPNLTVSAFPNTRLMHQMIKLPLHSQLPGVPTSYLDYHLFDTDCKLPETWTTFCHHSWFLRELYTQSAPTEWKNEYGRKMFSTFSLHKQAESCRQIPNPFPRKLPTLIFLPSKLQDREHTCSPRFLLSCYVWWQPWCPRP